MPLEQSPIIFVLFCRVVDNYGDAGVCLRLARQLVTEHGAVVYLVTDDLRPFRKMHVPVDLSAEMQTIDGICFLGWQADCLTTPVSIADIVIEAFGCDLPNNVLRTLSLRVKSKPLWLNLEYLSAESWVEDFHGHSSFVAQACLSKHFFFPGFTAQTGGLLRERNLMKRRDALQTRTLERCALSSLGINSIGLADPSSVLVSLFCYPHAPVSALFSSLAVANEKTICYVPEGVATAAIEEFTQQVLVSGESYVQGNLTVEVIPFLSQDDYDQLLWTCDWNFVRGEDSFVRAQFAGRPFVWQIYPQSGDAHLPKLDAFIDCYTVLAPSEFQTRVRRLFYAWNGQRRFEAEWAFCQSTSPAAEHSWEAHAKAWARSLASQSDLATNLLQYAKKFG